MIVLVLVLAIVVKKTKVKKNRKRDWISSSSLPNVPEMDICTDDANEDERFLHFGERRRTEGIL
jgi:hypothetical protein